MAGTVLEQADRMLRYFKRSKEKYYSVTTEQAELIKQFWYELHEYCNPDQFTFNDEFTKLRRDYETTNS